EEKPPEAARELLRRKIQSVRQPLTWRESLRLSWNAGPLKAQTRAWAFGVAVSGLLFFIGATLRDTPHAPKSVPLASWQVPSGVEKPAGNQDQSVRLPGSALVVRKFPESPLVAGRPALLYLSVAPLRPLSEVEIYIRPSFGVGIGGRAVPQADASYLLHRGPLTQETWVPVEIRPTVQGECTLRLLAYAKGRLVVDEEIPLHVSPR
ncbi:MAG: hypothetical protein QHJ73_17735, partial [Armatimonadota bacterium]|nr:hypothetical protein [Armatimonadota bacterium]